MTYRIAVLISGEGTNLQALIDSVHGREGVDIVGVASSRSDARGLERAHAAGVETAVFALAEQPDREARDRSLGDWLEAQAVDLVVLAGFMEILSGAFIRRFAGRILNVHPSLLPAFTGIRAIEQALAYGVKVLGVTVHLVDEGVDTGPIVLQEAIECPYSRDIAEVEQRIHEVEHRLLPRAVRLFAQGRVTVPDGSRIVEVTDERG
jgi:phosphoribosylglycinamide formyltransferase-1